MGIDFGAPTGAIGVSPADQVAEALFYHELESGLPGLTLARICELTGYRPGAVLDAIRTLRSRGQSVTANPSPTGTVYRLGVTANLSRE